MKHLCALLGIDHVKTSPYHPQSNGCLERWHSTLKAALRKHPKLVKYILFACRSAPHSNTGYSPFELIFGRQLRGPLDIVHEGWIGGELKLSSVIEWINNLKDKLALVWEVAVESESTAKQKMAHRSEETARARSFSPGDQVLVRVVDPGGKLGDRWEGPFEIVNKIADVTYRVAVPNKREKAMTAHVNRIKKWNTPDASVLRVIVADDEEEESEQETACNKSLSSQQLSELEKLLAEYGDRLDGSLGKGIGLEHAIDTTAHSPVWTPPHRIAPAWKEPLKEEIKAWLEQGVIQPSNSPWSSPVVPVRKPDGSLRLCIDYHNLNKIIVPDPYPILHIG